MKWPKYTIKILFVLSLHRLAFGFDPSDQECDSKTDKKNLSSFIYQKIFASLSSDTIFAKNFVFEEIRKKLNEKNPHKNDVACVRIGTDISSEEKICIKKRLEKVLPSLKLFLDNDNSLNEKNMPRIAVCASGGGFRSMVATLGLLIGMQEIGLLDCVSHISALSGSTWMVGPWVYGKIPLNKFKSKVKPCFEHFLTLAEAEMLHVPFVTKMFFNQPISLVDFFGALVARSLLATFGNQRYSARLSELSVDSTLYPFPIFSVVRPLNRLILDSSKAYEWFEISNCEVGSADIQGNFGAFVPTWAFGRAFKKGVSTDFAPEQSLGLFMGVCGSAFEASLKDLMPDFAADLVKAEKDLAKNLPDILAMAPSSLKPFIPDSDHVIKDINKTIKWILMHRRSPAQFNNFIPVIRNSHITLVDAGIACNLPMYPLLRKERAIDVIIVLDASAPIGQLSSLRIAQLLAQSRSFEFPQIDYSKAKANLMSVFDDGKNGTPVIIYIPLKSNPDYDLKFDVSTCENQGYCSTFNLHYTDKEVEQLSGLTRYTVKQHTSLIKDTLKKVATRKRSGQ